MKREYVSFKTKLVVAAVILGLEAIVLGGFWLVLALAGEDRPLDAPELPPPASLIETSGTVIAINVHTGRRTGLQHRPIVEFSVNGNLQQIGTRSSYGSGTIPFKEGDTVGVLYNSATPDKGWVKWEYDRYYLEINTPGIKTIVRTLFNFVALGILGLTALLLLYYFVKPLKNDA